MPLAQKNILEDVLKGSPRARLVKQITAAVSEESMVGFIPTCGVLSRVTGRQIRVSLS